MKHLAMIVSFFLMLTTIASAQPMSGSFTIGGSSPDFLTPQDAANAVKARGVSGSVTFNLRPGTYVDGDSLSPVMVIDSIIAGVSPINRITFQPDAASGGNVDNTIFQANFKPSQNSAPTAVRVAADYVAFRNVTFRDVDSMNIPASFLLRGINSNNNPTVEGLVVDGCSFVGAPYPFGQPQGVTEFGIGGNSVTSARITNSHFVHLFNAIVIGEDQFGDSLGVEDCRFESGTGNGAGGGAIRFTFQHCSIRRNFITGIAGQEGIRARFPIDGIIEGNYVQGGFGYAGLRTILHSSAGDRTNSFTIANNIVISGAGTATLDVQTQNTKVLHNTILHNGGTGSSGLQVVRPNCTVLNNILLQTGCTTAYEQGAGVGLVSNHNILFSACGPLVDHNFTTYPDLASYQAGTQLDTNSASKFISFEFDSLGIHLDECQSQDPALFGIPLQEVPTDFYGTVRDSVRPFVGAVEGVRLPYDMYADPFKAGFSGTPFSVATTRINGGNSYLIAVPNYDQRQVLLFHNTPGSRAFIQSTTLFTEFRPAVVKFIDVDRDHHTDLVVGGQDTNAVTIFWGDASGSFSGSSTVPTLGAVENLAPSPRSNGFQSIILTEDNGFLPNSSFVGFIMCDSVRHLCHEALRRPPDEQIDTLTQTLGDFVALPDTNAFQEDIVALSLAPFPPSVCVIKGMSPFIVFGGSPCFDEAFDFSQFSENHLRTGQLTFSSSIAADDFDNDGDQDFITTGGSENNCILLRNNGDLTFTADTISTTRTRGVVALDYDNDGDLDFVAVNNSLNEFGITVFLNNGSGHFTEKPNCFFPFATGNPMGIVAADFDSDGKTDVAIVATNPGFRDSLFVLYNLGGFNATTSVAPPRPNEIPQGFTLYQNYPNPFNPSTHIEYSLPSQSHITIKLYNILGQEITTLVDEEQDRGNHLVVWNGGSNGLLVGTGVYFYRIEARQRDGQFLFSSVKKMVLIK